VKVRDLKPNMRVRIAFGRDVEPEEYSIQGHPRVGGSRGDVSIIDLVNVKTGHPCEATLSTDREVEVL
jgi:hypothetical protein